MREDWIEVELGDVCDVNMGQSPPSSTYNTDKIGLPFFQGKAEFTELYPIVKKWCSEPKKIANKGDILLSVRAPVGSTNIANQKCSIGRGLAAISYNYSNSYLWYYLKRIEQKLDSEGTGTTFKAISGNVLKSQIFPLAPLPIQRAIVSKIETLFSDLDNGIADLKKAQAQLKIYRQAVLKKAFEGELTKAWREEQTNLPTADELLEQIKQERHSWLESEISNGNNEAKRIKAKLNKSTYYPSNEGLPNRWRWSTFMHSCLFVIDCHNKTAPYENDGIFLVRTTNIRNGKLDLVNKIKFVSENTYKFWSRRAYPTSGDMIFTREAPMGEAAIIPIDTKICLGQRTMLLRTIPTLLEIKYLLYNILSEVFQQRMRDGAIGTGVKHLRVGDVESLSFPLCSKQEQHQIVREIESRLSVCDKVEQSISESLEKSEALRQSILKKAFEGTLLSEAEIEKCKQETDYEPASELLKKINAEKK